MIFLNWHDFVARFSEFIHDLVKSLTAFGTVLADITMALYDMSRRPHRSHVQSTTTTLRHDLAPPSDRFVKETP